RDARHFSIHRGGGLDLRQGLAEAGNGKDLNTRRGSRLPTAHGIEGHLVNESQVFTNALKLATPAERSAYLDRACAGDHGMRAAVEDLLRAHVTDPGFLERPAGSLGGAPEPATASAKPPAPEPGGVLIAGRYKLLDQIDEGGMGTVWMAQQTE